MDGYGKEDHGQGVQHLYSTFLRSIWFFSTQTIVGNDVEFLMTMKLRCVEYYQHAHLKSPLKRRILYGLDSFVQLYCRSAGCLVPFRLHQSCLQWIRMNDVIPIISLFEIRYRDHLPRSHKTIFVSFSALMALMAKH